MNPFAAYPNSMTRRIMNLMNHKGWCGSSAPHPLSKRLGGRSSPLVNGKNPVASSLPLSALMVERKISLTVADCENTLENSKKNYEFNNKF